MPTTGESLPATFAGAHCCWPPRVTLHGEARHLVTLRGRCLQVRSTDRCLLRRLHQGAVLGAGGGGEADKFLPQNLDLYIIGSGRGGRSSLGGPEEARQAAVRSC